MELRKAEQEVNDLILAYQSLRQKKIASLTTSGGIGNGNDNSSSSLTSLVDLTKSIQENNSNATSKEEENGSTDCDSSALEDVTTDNTESEPISPRDFLSSLRSIDERMNGMEMKTTKFRKRMTEKDPITNASRYGEKTMTRVVSLLESYDALKLGLDIAFGRTNSMIPKEANGGDDFGENSHETVALVDEISLVLRREEEELQMAQQESEARRKELEELSKQKAAQAEERKKREEIEAQLAKQREEAELARRAELARQERLEEERRAVEEEREADRAFVASVTKGAEGVRTHLVELRRSCCGVDSTSSLEGEAQFSVAIGALHTIFSQIAAHPEEAKFRRIRRDHPKFMEDIGRHVGGKEVLIAAGFRFEKIDDVPCLYSKEPNIESDMDGWSEWFNLLKRSLEIIEEEMIK